MTDSSHPRYVNRFGLNITQVSQSEDLLCVECLHTSEILQAQPPSVVFFFALQLANT